MIAMWPITASTVARQRVLHIRADLTLSVDLGY